MMTITVHTAVPHERPRRTGRRVLGSAVLMSLLIVGVLAAIPGEV